MQWAYEDSNLGPHPYQGCALNQLSYAPLPPNVRNGRTNNNSLQLVVGQIAVGTHHFTKRRPAVKPPRPIDLAPKTHPNRKSRHNLVMFAPSAVEK